MLRPPSSSVILRFDVYALDQRAGELFKSGRKIKVQEQPLQILAMLLERPGEVVTREELRQKLWSEDTFVDFEHSLNTAIKKLRRALNDEADEPRYIETLRKRGYRFTGTVTEEAAQMAQAAAAASAVAGPLGGVAQKSDTRPGGDLIGKILTVRNEGGQAFVCLPVNEETLEENQMLNTAQDDLGLALMFADGKMLMVTTGTRVKVLQSRLENSSYAVRILDGEHIAKVALVPDKMLV